MNAMPNIDEMWNEPDAAEAAGGGSPVPDGDYQARVDYVDVRQAKSSGNWMLHWELVIDGGEQNGKKLYRNNMLSTARNIGYLKKDLKTCGIDIYDPDFKPQAFLDDDLNSLLDLVLTVTVKSKQDASGTVNTNVWLNTLQGRDTGQGIKPIEQEPPFDPFGEDKK